MNNEPEDPRAEASEAPPPKAANANGKRGAGVGTSAAAATPPKAADAPWSNKDADLMLEEMLGTEHPRALSKYGKSAYDITAYVAQYVGGKRQVIDTIRVEEVLGGNGVSAGEALRNRIEQSHLTVGQGPGTYNVRFGWRQGAEIYGVGEISFSSPQEIITLKRARAQAGAAGAPPYQPAYQQSSQQPPPVYTPNPQPPPAGYGAQPVQPPYPPYQPPQQQPSHDPEVSHLRTEVAGLSGQLREQMQHNREMMEYIRGERRAPPVPPPVAQPPGVGAPPYDPREWPRRQPQSEMEELREELADLRSDIAGLYRRPPGSGSGFGGAPPAQAAAVHPPPQQQPRQPDPVPKGPNGEIWVDRVGWCVPKDQIQTQPVPAPVPVVQQPAAAAATAAGVGAVPAATQTPQNPILAVAQAARDHMRAGKVLRDVLTEMNDSYNVGVGEIPEPTPDPTPEPGASLPFEVVAVEGAELFGHPVKYTPNKKTGKLDLEGFAMSNPGVLEEGAKLLGVAVEAVSTFAKRAAATTATAGGVGAPQIAAGVGQVVESVPEGARDASGRAPGVPGAGSFPAV